MSAEDAGARFEIAWETDGPPALPRADVEHALAAALAHGGRPDAGLSVVFVDDETLAELHARHLDDPSHTDVITFDLGDDGHGPAGELYVSVDRARTVATARGSSPARELMLYLVHGALHLCGFDDQAEDDRALMRRAEAEVLATLGFAPDREPHDLDGEL